MRYDTWEYTNTEREAERGQRRWRCWLSLRLSGIHHISTTVEYRDIPVAPKLPQSTYGNFNVMNVYRSGCLTIHILS